MEALREYYNAAGESGSDVLYAGVERCRPGHRWGGLRDHFLMHFVASGEGEVHVDGKKQKLGKGSAFVFFPHQRHFYQAASEKPWRYFWVGFRGKNAVPLLQEAGLHPGNSIFRNRHLPGVTGDFQRLMDELKQKPPGYAARAEGWLYFILGALIAAGNRAARPLPVEGPSGGQAYVEEAKRFIETNYHRAISVGQVTRHLGFDRTYFSNLFRKTTGKTLKEHLTQVRLDQARTLLKGTALKVHEVGASVGYPEYFTFVKRFKAATGKTPTAFRGRD